MNIIIITHENSLGVPENPDFDTVGLLLHFFAKY